MKTTILLFAAVAATLLAAPALAAQDLNLPDVDEDGLHLIPDSKMAIVYAEPEADLSAYQRIMLMESYVAFKKDWARNQRGSSVDRLSVTSKDIENIKNNLAKEFNQVFTEVLTEGGYEMVNEAADDVLLIRPAIINLDVKAPDTPRRSNQQYSYTDSAGEMTLYLELYDSVTGDLIAKALDRRVDRNSGFYTWSNTVTNRVAAQRILKGWANILLDALNEAKK